MMRTHYEKKAFLTIFDLSKYALKRLLLTSISVLPSNKGTILLYESPHLTFPMLNVP